MSAKKRKLDLKAGDYGNFTITEHIQGRNVKFNMQYILHKGRLVIFDSEGNRLAIDKRPGWVAIDRQKGKVEWHKDDSKPSATLRIREEDKEELKRLIKKQTDSYKFNTVK